MNKVLILQKDVDDCMKTILYLTVSGNGAGGCKDIVPSLSLSSHGRTSFVFFLIMRVHGVLSKHEKSRAAMSFDCS